MAGPAIEPVRRKPILVALAMGVAAMVAPATAAPMTGAEIRQAVTGNRIYLATPFGGEFPLHFKPNGEVTGDGTALGLGRFAAPRETGRWFIEADRLCHQFPTWNGGRVSCFTLERTGESTLIWRRTDGRSGRARIDG
ncbi:MULTISPECIES: hypothetical protein [unclassified Roseitalea]|uniref:hypothetical protein n=1 Tax=unclassified Roseitalea TaxID=2639107 RepID=UPI00273FA1EA|nr:MULTISPECIES: hypothetical protein [unclassified Roseitalea]